LKLLKNQVQRFAKPTDRQSMQKKYRGKGIFLVLILKEMMFCYGAVAVGRVQAAEREARSTSMNLFSIITLAN